MVIATIAPHLLLATRRSSKIVVPREIAKMLDSSDEATIVGIRELTDIIRAQTRPVLLWIGAGASRWAGYPGWLDLAEGIDRTFRRYQKDYPSQVAAELLREGRLPGFFSLARAANEPRYFQELSNAFEPRAITPVYERLTRALAKLPDVSILTTNVDDQLERCVDAIVVQASEIERAHTLLQERNRFVCKLHGSVSALKSMIFTEEDYAALVSADGYIEYLSRILGSVTVVFCGYSLGDEYLLRVLENNTKLARLFGDGPHFALLSDCAHGLPASIRVLRYRTSRHADHRSQLDVIEEMAFAHVTPTPVVQSVHEPERKQDVQSAHLIFDIFPPGTWQTSQTLTFEPATDDGGREIVIGTGFKDGEITGARVTALHDLLVGLICFDVTYAPITTVGRIHQMIGGDAFWTMVAEGCIRFVSWQHTLGVMFSDPNDLAGGRLLSIAPLTPDKLNMKPIDMIRRQLQPAPGRFKDAETQFEALAASTRTIEADEEVRLTQLTRDLLLRPSIRRLIGMSEGTPLDSLARWQVFPALRVAHIAQIATVCQILNIGSAKLNFGAAALAGQAFALAGGIITASETASYVVAGRFAADLGVTGDVDGLIRAVLTFRKSAEAASLRAAVRAGIQKNESSEFSLSVNAALQSALSPAVLDRAKRRFVGLYKRERENANNSSAVFWNDEEDSGRALEGWKQRFRAERELLFRNRNLQPYDLCPCKSGEKLKFCCAAV